jgi:hypothetical protein
VILVDDDGPGIQPSIKKYDHAAGRPGRRSGSGLRPWSRDRTRYGGDLWRIDFF